jgi:hypothetical protein
MLTAALVPLWLLAAEPAQHDFTVGRPDLEVRAGMSWTPLIPWMQFSALVGAEVGLFRLGEKPFIELVLGAHVDAWWSATDTIRTGQYRLFVSVGGRGGFRFADRVELSATLLFTPQFRWEAVDERFKGSFVYGEAEPAGTLAVAVALRLSPRLWLNIEPMSATLGLMPYTIGYTELQATVLRNYLVFQHTVGLRLEL